MSILHRSVFAFLLAAGGATVVSAQWTGGERVTVGAGTTLTVDSAQPDIFSLTNNGSLTFAAGGSVTITGNAVSAIGADGATGVLTVQSGGLVAMTTNKFVVGLQGGDGTLSVEAGGVFDLNNGALTVCGNNSATTRDPATRGAVNIAGHVRVGDAEFTSFFPNTPEDDYVDAGVMTLLPGGLLEVRRVVKNDRAVSRIYLNGGTVKTRAGGAFHSISNGGYLYYIVGAGGEARFDTGGNDVVFNAANGGAFMSISGDGGLRKLGAGVLTFQLADTNNTFTGNIVVEEGVLNLARPLAPNQQVTVHAGAVFVPNTAGDIPKITWNDAGKALFTVGWDIDSLNLAAYAPDYHTDRLGSPFTGTATLSGALTYDALSGTPANPFRLVTQGGTLCLTNTGLENAHIQIEGSSTAEFQGDRVFTPADDGKIRFTDGGLYQQRGRFTMTGTPTEPALFALEAPARFSTVGADNALEVGVGGDATFFASNSVVNAERLRIAGTPGVVGAFVQDGGQVTSSQEVWVGYDSGTGRLDVANGVFRVNSGSLRVAGGFGDTVARPYRPHGIVNVSNATVYVSSQLNFTPYFPSDAATANAMADELYGEVNLYAGGLLDVASINKNDSATSSLFFDGGTLRIRNGGNPIGMAERSRLRFSAAADSYIALDIPGADTWFWFTATDNRRMFFTGDGGLKKLGSGALAFYGYQVDYRGDTVVEAGTLRLNTVNILPSGAGYGDIVLQNGATVLDLNAFDAKFNRVLGSGTVMNRTGTVVTMGVLADGSDDVWTRGTVGPIVLDKLGAGTMTLSGYNLAAGGLKVSEGTVRVAPSEGYPFYRFKVEGTRDPNCNTMQFCELRLFDGDVNVVPFRTNLFWDATYSDTHLTANQTYPGNEAPPNVVNGNKPAESETTVQGSGNKWLDFRIAATRSPEDRDRVWVRLDFAGAQRITRYDWATSNDSNDRDPVAWRLQGSYTGDDWVDLDVKSGYPTSTWRFKWVSDGAGFPVDTANVSGQTLAPGVDVTLGGGTKFVLDGVSETVGGLNGFGEVTLDGGNLTISSGGDARDFFAGAIQGTGSVIKKGAGTQVFNGATTFTGDFIVQEGTAEIATLDSEWFRLTIKKNRSNVNVLQLSEFALYDSNGIRCNAGLTEGADVHSLAPGQFATPEAYTFGTGNGGEGPDKLFDDKTNTKWCLLNNTPSPDTPSTWRTVVMRLAPSDVASYNIATANDSNERDPTTWVLEHSFDGDIWLPLDAKNGFIPVTNRFTWYNNEQPFPVGQRAAPAAGASMISDGAVVEVKDGATLAIVGNAVPISALRVDMAAGSGEITRFTPAANGALYLTNTSGSPTSWVIPITFGTVDDPATLKTWSVYADGQPLDGYRLMYNAATSTFRLFPKGTIILIQ